jgi:tetratricopeptide (TPR) repeat protein
MQEKLTTTNNQNYPWLGIVETVSVVGSVGASIASIFINQAALASIPLSITVMLNLVNRRLQLEAMEKNNQSAISQLMQEDVKILDKVSSNNQQIVQLQQLTVEYEQVKSNVQEHSQNIHNNQSEIANLLQEQSETQGKIHTINELLTQSSSDFEQLKSDTQDYTAMLQTGQLEMAELLQNKAEVQTTVDSLVTQVAEIQEIIPSLIEGNSNLMDYAKLQSLYEEQMEVVKKVGYLREIDSSTQAIRIAPYDPDAYYKRGMSFLALGDRQGSIGDFTEAIQLNSSHAPAYYSRGLAHIELGNKKRAVQDLREAAKLFFDAGDIANYQMAKDASKQIHELNSEVNLEDAHQVAVGSLFG